MEVRASDMDECSVCAWHDRFKQYAVDTVIIPLSADFLSYLKEDGLILPSSHATVDHLSDDEDYQVVDEPTQTRNFDELEKQVTEAINQLGGEVFVKLNWSAASDAAWINCNSLKCSKFHEVVMLLKSSDRIMFDMENIYDSCSDSEALIPHQLERSLVLKRWMNIEASMEFRVFIYKGQLQGTK
jgi:hypothetical protein